MSVFNDYLPWTFKRFNCLSQEQWKTLLAASEGVTQDQSAPITPLMLLLWKKIVGQEITTFKQRARLIDWYRNTAYSIWNLDQLDAFLSQSPVKICAKKSPGFNLIGYDRAKIGLGEDLRGYASLFEQQNIAYSIYHVGHPSDGEASIFSEKQRYDLPFDKSIFCMNIIELRKLFTMWSGSLQADFGRVIFAPPWELPTIPDCWVSTLEKADEIWAISKFLAASYKAVEAIKNKIKYVRPVVLPPCQYSKKTELRQKRPFIFMYIFDAGSYLRRKNPQAVIQAFLYAFPHSFDEVRLVIKVSNVNAATLGWAEFEAYSRLDTRITIVSATYTDSAMEQLWEQCSCYVSLHRSEGFGRTIAEAVARKIPVISTDWSGSTDITRANRKLNVIYTLVDLQPGDYPFWEGQRWAEPNICDAASKMRWVFLNKNSENLREITHINFEYFQEAFSLNYGIKERTINL